MTRVCAIVGPTAVGKTRIALDVAADLQAEVVSVDSMQVYRGMDIGTDKASGDMRERVPHHLLDLKDPDRDLTVAEFQALARRAIADISERGKLPLLVGGSGLYFRAIVDDLQFPPRSPAIRRHFEERAEEEGAETLYRELDRLDPVAASRIEPGNARRIVRALEVIELTGRPFSDNDAWERYESRYELKVAGLERPREELYTLIARRVHEMLQAGLVEEVQRVNEDGLSVTARQALGYKQVLDLGPQARVDELHLEIMRATKRFARRQLAWFKADPRITWFDASAPGVTEALKAFFGATEG